MLLIVAVDGAGTNSSDRGLWCLYKGSLVQNALFTTDRVGHVPDTLVYYIISYQIMGYRITLRDPAMMEKGTSIRDLRVLPTIFARTADCM